MHATDTDPESKKDTKSNLRALQARDYCNANSRSV